MRSHFCSWLVWLWNTTTTHLLRHDTRTQGGGVLSFVLFFFHLLLLVVTYVTHFISLSTLRVCVCVCVCVSGEGRCACVFLHLFLWFMSSLNCSLLVTQQRARWKREGIKYEEQDHHWTAVRCTTEVVKTCLFSCPKSTNTSAVFFLSLRVFLFRDAVLTMACIYVLTRCQAASMAPYFTASYDSLCPHASCLWATSVFARNPLLHAHAQTCGCTAALTYVLYVSSAKG